MKGRAVGTKTPYRVDIFTIVLVTALVLFGLVTLLDVLSDPFDGTEKTFADFYERLNFEYFSRQIGNILISLVVLVCFVLFVFLFCRIRAAF